MPGSPEPSWLQASNDDNSPPPSPSQFTLKQPPSNVDNDADNNIQKDFTKTINSANEDDMNANNNDDFIPSWAAIDVRDDDDNNDNNDNNDHTVDKEFVGKSNEKETSPLLKTKTKTKPKKEKRTNSPSSPRVPPPTLRPYPLRSFSHKLSLTLNIVTILSSLLLFFGTAISINYSLTSISNESNDGKGRGKVGVVGMAGFCYLLAFTVCILLNETGFLKGSTSSSSNKSSNKSKRKRKTDDSSDDDDSENNNSHQHQQDSKLSSWFIRGFLYLFIGLFSSMIYIILGNTGSALLNVSDSDSGGSWFSFSSHADVTNTKDDDDDEVELYLPKYITLTNRISAILLTTSGIVYMLLSLCCMKSISENSIEKYNRKVEKWNGHKERWEVQGKAWQKEEAERVRVFKEGKVKGK